jgi:hypothetical protein
MISSAAQPQPHHVQTHHLSSHDFLPLITNLKISLHLTYVSLYHLIGDPLSFAASLLGIASFGISMVTTLSTFTLSYTSASEKISSLSAEVSVTSSILTSLGSTIQEYEAEFHFKIDNFQNAKAACERNFNNLGKAIKAMKRGESKDVIGKKAWREVAPPEAGV